MKDAIAFLACTVLTVIIAPLVFSLAKLVLAACFAPGFQP